MPEFDSTTEYRPIPDFPGYVAGSDGSIWTCRERGGPHQWRLGHIWQPMTLTIGPAGYRRITVTRADGKRLCRTVHVLVLESFVGRCPDGLQARHLDGDRLNCRADNLAWGTVQANHDDKQRHGTTAKGERDGNSKLTAPEVLEMRRRMAAGESPKLVGPAFGVSDVLAYLIRKRRIWKHV